MAVAKLAAAMIFADGHVDPLELDVAYREGGALGISRETIDEALERRRKHSKENLRETLGAVPPTAREAAAGLLFEIADVDGRLDSREVELLHAVRDAWKVRLEFLNKPLIWDDDQREVIEASATRRTLVSAGPGMGKTAVACARVAHLIDTENVHDGSIWLVSFTRAAVAELNGRIDDFADDPDTGFAVKISTLDSQAWKLRHGFEAETVTALFGGFDTSIEKAIALLAERDSEIREYLADMEHVLIDEAQDITGDRARFLLGLLSRLPLTCGVTIFHDDAQAIYDHTMEDGDDFRFVDGAKADYGDTLESRALAKIYRTEDPKLLSLYEMLRLDILDGEAATSEAFERRADIVKRAAHSEAASQFGRNDLDDGPDPLVLFRQRAEVVRASSYLSADGVTHRLRMSGLPKPFHPWLALTLGRAGSMRIDEAEFRDLHQQAQGSFAELLGTSSDAIDDRWDRLRRVAAEGRRRIDLERLRSASGRRPDGLTMPEYGNKGPILGTIHASKGREAERVVLQMHKDWGRGKDTDFEEESRVLFVGASRAKKNLDIRRSTANPYAQQTESGRIWVANGRYKNAYQIQVGLDGDYDHISALRRQPDIVGSAADFDGPTSCTATLVPGDWTYELMRDDGAVPLGHLTPMMGRDCMEIGRFACGRDPEGRWKSPYAVKYINLLGYGTAIAPPGEALPVGPDRFGGKGIWMVPLISGFTLAFLR